MKKSKKLSIGLVTSFIGALALTSCSEDVTWSKTSVVDIIGYNSQTNRIEINVDELYREYGESKEGTTKYYNAVLEALIRYEYPQISKNDSDLKSYDRIKSEANDKLKSAIQTANDNANNNGTNFDDEWDKILESNNVETTEELRLKFEYELEKEAITDWYFKKNSETEGNKLGLRQEYIGVAEVEEQGEKVWKQIEPATENVDPVFPYHVIHILVKLSSDATDYTRATISESEAEKLWDIVRHLVDGQYTFEETAKLSDDTSSSEYGDVELMSTKTSFYNEFKLGTYAYDAILSKINKEEEGINDDIYAAFGIDKDAEVVTKTMNNNGFMVETKEKLNDYEEQGVAKQGLINKAMLTGINLHLEEAQINLPAIPFDVFRQIGLLAKEDKIGTFTPEGSSASLPRNVLFNAFLNFRSPFVITNELLDQSSVAFGDDAIGTTEYNFSDPDVLKLQSNNFQAGKLGAGFNKKVLCDTNGNVVIGVKSSAGIHFMVMRKSVFQNTNKMSYEKVVYKDNGEIDPQLSVLKTNTTLEDYYTVKTPFDKEGYPTGHETYVNIKNVNDVSYYTNRANTIKNDIKSSNFDAAYDYRLYEALLEYPLEGGALKNKIHFSDETADGKSVIRTNIDKTIKDLRENAALTQEEAINKAWKEYLIQLLNQNELRSDAGMYKGAFVPTTCAFSFKKGNEAEWKEEGGRCYVK